MSNITIGFRISDHLHQQLEEYRTKAYLTKSEVIVSFIDQYLGAVEDILFSQRVIDLEERMTKLEAQVQAIQN
ncbi:DNA-binding domain-containing protein [Okeania hirsuta]|uniref:DNA-binding domain-containing protein n=1 Tax=Okeania hirsuta TaxID=1458930 RepID=A0A3N6RQF4_9CYAN|nr:DNA-binding domain-containing protein [Okeania hirsuta]RQH43302.1 DNA-binding domain-containing protein [Okeania hirsuta]